MEIILAAAYLLPILILMAFIGKMGKRYILYLFWGFLASIPVLLLYPVIIQWMPSIPYPSVTVSPLLEEFFKALPIIIPALIGIRNSDEDLLVCAMASGVGFSIIENWTLLDPVTLELTLGNFLGLLARSFSTSLMHGCMCGIIGYGIVLTRNADRRALPALLFGFYTLSVTSHSLYNLLADYFGEAGIIVDLVFPVLLFLLLLTCYHVDIPALYRKSGSS
jgi:RsiW-degrading membrane proteinase PrsW (M82 family)